MSKQTGSLQVGRADLLVRMRMACNALACVGSVAGTCSMCDMGAILGWDATTASELHHRAAYILRSKLCLVQEVVRRRLSSYEERGSSSGVPADVEEEEEGEERERSDL